MFYLGGGGGEGKGKKKSNLNTFPKTAESFSAKHKTHIQVRREPETDTQHGKFHPK